MKDNRRRSAPTRPADSVPTATGIDATYYDLHAREYARETQSTDLRVLWERFERHLSPRARILDLGCGAGRDLRRFAERGFTVVGVDLSVPLARIAKEFSGQSVVVADARALPFRDGSFDAVWTVATLLHIRRDAIGQSLMEARRALRPGGVAFTSVKEGHGEIRDSRGRLTVLYSQAEWTRLLEQNQLSIIETDRGLEHRRDAAGHNAVVTWINCVAIARPHRLGEARPTHRAGAVPETP